MTHSFLLKKSSTLFNRRSSKILSTIVSTFTSAYIFHWQSHFSEADQEHVELKYPPSFDGRIVLYPDAKHVRDYFAWRQTDSAYCRVHCLTDIRLSDVVISAHVNNLYNTVFWALVQQGGLSTTEAHARLRVSLL
jgi:tRNA(His) guanylyltransferase